MGVILFAEDDEAMRVMVSDVLGTAGHQVRLAPDGSTALREVRSNPPDLVILDYRMGTPNGLEVCRQIKADPRLEHLPVLILTAQGKVEDRIRGFDAGANDYLPKPFDARELLGRVRALLALSQQGLDRNPTTGLPGGDAVEREIDKRRRDGASFAVCYLDLDHFKPFNDRFGFATADAVIRTAGDVLRSADDAAAGCFTGHIGGDDFVLICAPESARESVLGIQERFRERLRNHLPAEVYDRGSYRGVDRDGQEREFPLTAFAAAILYVGPEDRSSLEELGEVAAEAKRRAKQAAGGIAEVELPPPSGARGR